MREFRGKVAVVTGAGSGIGRGLARRFVREGCRVVLADISEESLAAAEMELRDAGGTVEAVKTDVSDSESVENLAQATLDAFGAVHIVCNNAGVGFARGGGIHIWDTSLAEWEWAVGVNIWGVVHGCRTFTPILLEQDEEAHIVNTASAAAMLARSVTHIYNMTKHAVLSLTESLALQLAETNPKIGVSALCPGFAQTNLINAYLNAPEEVQRLAENETEAHQAARSRFERVFAGGLSVDEVADHVIEAIKSNRLYVLTHPEYNDLMRMRMDDILDAGTLDRYSTQYNAFLQSQADRPKKG